MTSTTTAHIYAQTQHAEYEAQAAQYTLSRNARPAASQGTTKETVMGKIALLLQQVREHAASQPAGQLTAKSQQ